MLMSSSDTAKFLAGCKTETEQTHWAGHGCVPMERVCSRSLPLTDGIALRLRRVEHESFCGTVYNLHVEEDESFVVGGLAVHNCQFAREAISEWGTGITVGVAQGGASLGTR